MPPPVVVARIDTAITLPVAPPTVRRMVLIPVAAPVWSGGTASTTREQTLASAVPALALLLAHDLEQASALLDRGMARLIGHGPAAPLVYWGLWALLHKAVADRGEQAREYLRAAPAVLRDSNRAALAYADAVAAGRAGLGREASALMTTADELLTGQPWWRRLLRLLVLEAAMVDGWGDPVPALRADTDNVLRSLRRAPGSDGDGLVLGIGVRYASAVLDAGAGTRAPRAWGPPRWSPDLHPRPVRRAPDPAHRTAGRAVAPAVPRSPPPACRSPPSRSGHDLLDDDGTFADRYALGDTGAALVRPDGYLAWRTSAPGADAWTDLRRSLDLVLGRAAPVLAEAG